MKFDITHFTQLCQFIECRTEEEFIQMYRAIGIESNNDVEHVYAKGKFVRAKSDFIGWWCNLDTLNQEAIISYVINFYESKSK